MNIQEYVIEKVIKYMKYRDEEIKQLQDQIEILNKELERFNVIKCNFCEKYGDYIGECEFCEKQSCDKCNKVKKYNSWNISGCKVCDKCDLIYCTNCRNIKGECYKSGYCDES